MKRLLSLMFSVLIICCSFIIVFAGTETDSNEKQLQFNDGKFVILQISDSQDDHHPAPELINFIKLALQKAKPDLVVFTGDLVEDKRGADTGVDDEDTREGVCVYDKDGNIKHDETLENSKIAADAVLSIINDAKIPFAIAQGNNDHICGVTNKEWLQIYSEYEYCLTRDMSDDSDDRIDYNLLIKGTNGGNLFNIWCMDTGKSGVNNDQIKWYKTRCAELREQNGGKVIPAFVFQHIYVKDIGNLFERCNLWDDCCKAKGFGLYRLNRSVAKGNWVNVSVAPGRHTKQFKAWQKCGDVLGAYFGHEHYENYTGTYRGIELGFTNGCEFAKSGPYGIRVITLNENDIKNYSNDVYVYEGSVKTDNAAFVPVVDEKYPEYSDREEMFAAFKENIANNIKALFKEIFD